MTVIRGRQAMLSRPDPMNKGHRGSLQLYLLGSQSMMVMAADHMPATAITISYHLLFKC